MNNLVLFDIDGTLVDLTKAHIDSYVEAYQKLAKVDVPGERVHEKLGLPEFQIHEELFKEFGVRGVSSEEIVRSYSENFFRIISQRPVRRLEGVEDLLDELKRRNEHLGIVTGNLEDMGREILNSANLTNYFTVFGFDRNQPEGRAGIVKDAMNEARNKGYQWKRVFVIGDTDKDIEAGKANRAHTIGVATGKYDVEYLERAGADLVVPSFNGSHRKRVMGLIEAS